MGKLVCLLLNVTIVYFTILYSIVPVMSICEYVSMFLCLYTTMSGCKPQVEFKVFK